MCSLFLLAGTVCVAGCGDDDLKEYVSVGKIENQGGEVCFDKYSKSWYLRVPVPGSVDGVMEYILRNLLTSSRRKACARAFSGEYVDMVAYNKSAGTECYQITLSLIKKIE